MPGGIEEEQPYSFLADWFDPLPQLTKQFKLKYFARNNEAEMVDAKAKRLFLKRSPCPSSTSLKDFYIGARVLLYGRDLTIVGFGDEATRSRLTEAIAEAVVIIEPNSFPSSGKIIDCLQSQDLTLTKLKLFRLSFEESADLAGVIGQEDAVGFANSTNNRPLLAMVLIGKDVAVAVSSVLSTLNDKGVIWATDDVAVSDWKDFFFGPASRRFQPSATFDSCTCCVIKPHAVKAGDSGRILYHILGQGYEVSALELFHLDRAQATEFLEVYEGVVPEYKEMLDHLITAPCIAMELRAESAVKTFRQTAGPWDVDMAKELRPGTIRALYGKDKVMNAVHCTEMAEDGASECQYFFELLQA